MTAVNHLRSDIEINLLENSRAYSIEIYEKMTFRNKD